MVISDLRPGESRTLSLILKMQGQGPYRVSSYARGGVRLSASDSGTGVAIGEDAFTVHFFMEDKTDPVLVGEQVDYTINVAAQGLPYSGGVLHFRLPATLSFQGASPLPDSRDENGMVFFVPVIAAGEVFKAQITATGISSGPGVATAELSHADNSLITIQERTLVQQ